MLETLLNSILSTSLLCTYVSHDTEKCFFIYRAKGIAKCDEVDIVIPAICVEDEVKRSMVAQRDPKDNMILAWSF